MEQGRIVIGKDKTAAGTGRIVPLNVRALAALTAWAEQFPKREPEHYVFPTEKYGLHGEEGKFGGVVRSYKADVTKPIGTIKSAWESAKKRTRYHCPECKAGRLVSAKKPAMGYACEECGVLMDELPIGAEGFRFHDLRHTAVSRMIVGGAPLPVIAKVVGWKLSTVVDMAERYGHFEEDAMRRAVQAIGAAAPAPSTAKVLPMPQRPARLLHAAD